MYKKVWENEEEEEEERRMADVWKMRWRRRARRMRSFWGR